MPINFEKLSRADLGRAFGVTTRSIGHWVSQGCPVNRGGTFAFQKVYAWRLARGMRTGFLTVQQALLAKARGELLEITVADRRANLLPAAEARRLSLALAAAVRTELRTLPDSITAAVLEAGPLTAAATRNLLAEKIDAKLREISTAEFVGSLQDKP